MNTTSQAVCFMLCAMNELVSLCVTHVTLLSVTFRRLAFSMMKFASGKECRSLQACIYFACNACNSSPALPLLSSPKKSVLSRKMLLEPLFSEYEP